MSKRLATRGHLRPKRSEMTPKMTWVGWIPLADQATGVKRSTYSTKRTEEEGEGDRLGLM